jgi:hypothetical protein
LFTGDISVDAPVGAGVKAGVTLVARPSIAVGTVVQEPIKQRRKKITNALHFFMVFLHAKAA